VSRIENGIRTNVSASDLQKIAKALNIDPGKLLSFIGVKPSTKVPTPRVYLRRAYGLTAEEATEAATQVDEIIRQLREHKRNNNQPKGGETQ
jgi:transcriptional regulator with XRE-family HTH domain